METLERIIAKHPFFAGLESYYTGLLTGCAANVRFAAGTYIFKEGEEANEFYLLRSGKVALEIFAPQHKPISSPRWRKERFWDGRGYYRPISGNSTPLPRGRPGRLHSTESVCAPSANRIMISVTRF